MVKNETRSTGEVTSHSVFGAPCWVSLATRELEAAAEVGDFGVERAVGGRGRGRMRWGAKAWGPLGPAAGAAGLSRARHRGTVGHREGPTHTGFEEWPGGATYFVPASNRRGLDAA